MLAVCWLSKERKSGKSEVMKDKKEKNPREEWKQMLTKKQLGGWKEDRTVKLSG